MKQSSDYRIWKHITLWALIFLIFSLRLQSCWRSGEFAGEDGWVFFAGAYNEPWYTSIFTPYAGYFHLLPRILAELFSGMPIVYQPYVYVVFGMVFDAFLLSLFYYPHFEGVIRDSQIRAGVVVLMALSGNAENLGLLLGLHWYLAFAMALMLVMNSPKGRTGQFLMYGLGFLSCWTSPAVFVLFPFLLYNWRRGATSSIRRWSLFCVLNLVLVGLFVFWMRLENSDRTGTFGLMELLIAIDRMVLRGWLGCGLLGKWMTLRILHLHWAILYPWCGVGIGFLLWFGWRFHKRTESKHILILLVVALLMILLSLTRSLYIIKMDEWELPVHVRYLTAPTLLLIIAIWGIAYEFWSEGKRRLLYLCGLLQLLLFLISLPTFRHVSFREYSRIPGMFHLKDYVEAIHTFEDQYRETGNPASLYIPTDIIYWGPVLKKGGGYEHLTPAKLAEGLGLGPHNEGQYDSWLGRFRQIPDSVFIEHEKFGLLEYRGISEGRVWFRDLKNRLIITSPLLYPFFWVVDGLNYSYIILD
jgi:ABC-type cobalt transport system substrate-binding protein